MVAVIEESSDVRFKDPVNRVLTDKGLDGPERIMRAPLGAESLGGIEEIRLVEGAEEAGDRRLHQAIRHGRDAQRTQFGRLPRFRNVHPSDRRRLIRMAS